MSISASASNNDASNFTITETYGGNVSTRQGNLSLSQTITYGTGTLAQGTVQANAFTNNTGVISGSDSLQIDFRAITQLSAKSTYTVEYDQIRTIRFANTSSTTGTQLHIRATGANALSGVFNNQSGNLKICPRTTYTYSDYLDETPVSASNRYLYVHNDGNENVTYNLITMGISNTFTGTTDMIPSP